MNENTPVRVSECRCLGTPHADGDFVYLRPKLGWRHVTAIKWEILAAKEESEELPVSEILGVLSEGYLAHGIVEWNLTTPLTRAAVRSEILEDVERASAVSEKADELYGAQVMVPLARLAGKSSPTTQRNGSTSATNGSSREPRKRSKRSSTSTTPTDDTETTTPSLVGDSSS